jgi:hypothetical protein
MRQNGINMNTQQIESIQMESEESLSSNHKSTNKHRIIQTIVDFIVIIIIFIIFGFVYLFQDPKINYFTCDQSDIFFPNIPGLYLFVYYFVSYNYT